MKTSGKKIMMQSEKRRMAIGGRLEAKMDGTAHQMDSLQTGACSNNTGVFLLAANEFKYARAA